MGSQCLNSNSISCQPCDLDKAPQLQVLFCLSLKWSNDDGNIYRRIEMRQCIYALINNTIWPVIPPHLPTLVWPCTLVSSSMFMGCFVIHSQGAPPSLRCLTKQLFIRCANQQITFPSQEHGAACLGICACILSVMHNTYVCECVCALPPWDVYISHSPKRDLFQGTNASG